MKFFARNMGETERIARAAAGLSLVLWAMALFPQEMVWFPALLAATGLILIVEGIVAWCPLKALLGLGAQYHT